MSTNNKRKSPKLNLLCCLENFYRNSQGTLYVADDRKTERYDRLCLDLEEAGFQVSNSPTGGGCKGVHKPQEHARLGNNVVAV